MKVLLFDLTLTRGPVPFCGWMCERCYFYTQTAELINSASGYRDLSFGTGCFCLFSSCKKLLQCFKTKLNTPASFCLEQPHGGEGKEVGSLCPGKFAEGLS